MGLKPSDVNILPLGGSQVTYKALLSGQVQAALMSPPESFGAESNGYKLLQDTFSIPYQNNGVVVLRSRIAELTPALPGFLKGYRQGMLTFNAQPELAKQIVGKYTKEEDQAVLQKTYDFHRTSAPYQLDMQPNIEGIAAMLDFMSATVPAAKNAKPEQFVDTRFLSQLPKAS